MRKYRKRETFAEPGPRDFWHPYGLQNLRPEKFIAVVNAIMGGRQHLLPLRRHPQIKRTGVLPDRGR
jgi:hypothetical protein